MGRGKGVRLQKYKDGGLSDARTFTLAEGLSWLDPAGRTRTETDLAEWTAKRATAGRMAPRGFPRDNRSARLHLTARGPGASCFDIAKSGAAHALGSRQRGASRNPPAPGVSAGLGVYRAACRRCSPSRPRSSAPAPNRARTCPARNKTRSASWRHRRRKGRSHRPATSRRVMLPRCSVTGTPAAPARSCTTGRVS
jgi:hypothetical protein